MTTSYVSVANFTNQLITPKKYTLLKFPEILSDDCHMLSAEPELLHPSVAGIGLLELNIFWEADDYKELRDVFSRDPFGITSDPDNRTAYDHRPPSPGMQCFTKLHTIKVFPGVPLGVYAYHDATTSVNVTEAQFKLTIL